MLENTQYNAELDLEHASFFYITSELGVPDYDHKDGSLVKLIITRHNPSPVPDAVPSS